MNSQDHPGPTPGRLTAGTYSHHPFKKENDLNQTSRGLCSMLIFRGVPIKTYKNMNQFCSFGGSLFFKSQANWGASPYDLCTLEVQPPVLIGWFLRITIFKQGFIIVQKDSPFFLYAGWLSGCIYLSCIYDVSVSIWLPCEDWSLAVYKLEPLLNICHDSMLGSCSDDYAAASGNGKICGYSLLNPSIDLENYVSNEEISPKTT